MALIARTDPSRICSLCLAILFLMAGPAAAVDHSLFAELLDKYVKNGQVDYEGFKREEKKLDRYLDILAAVDPQSLGPDAQFAFYANAYNAWTIKLILGEYPDIESIKELGFLNTGPWRKDVIRLKGGKVSLDHIEHEILRPRFKDPRVHFAINCAAFSCPPLLSQPLRAETLDAQLNEATTDFVNNSKRNRLQGDTLYVSKIFKWFSEDFQPDVVSFFIQYARGDLKKALVERKDQIDVEYLDYDWSLNNRPQ